MSGSITSGKEMVIDLSLRALEYETPRPFSEYHEDMGPVLWWKFPIEEPPYVGTPADLPTRLAIGIHYAENGRGLFDPDEKATNVILVGGWIGDHTHFTPIPRVNAP